MSLTDPLSASGGGVTDGEMVFSINKWISDCKDQDTQAKVQLLNDDGSESNPEITVSDTAIVSLSLSSLIAALSWTVVSIAMSAHLFVNQTRPRRSTSSERLRSLTRPITSTRALFCTQREISAAERKYYSPSR
jgi:hypothetical protein